MRVYGKLNRTDANVFNDLKNLAENSFLRYKLDKIGKNDRFQYFRLRRITSRHSFNTTYLFLHMKSERDLLPSNKYRQNLV